MNMLTRPAAVVFTALSIVLACLGSALAQNAPNPADKGMGMSDARAIVLELPEVKAWQDERRKAAAANPKAPATGGIVSGARTLEGKKYWSMVFYSNPSTQPERWATFLVRASDGVVFVEGNAGKPVPLEQWRRITAKPTS
jgi:hypothetical protein